MSGKAAAADDLSIVIPFRADGPARVENIAAVLSHLRRVAPGAEIVVIEDAPVMCGFRWPEGVRHVARMNAGPFHRTRLLNEGIGCLATRRFAAAWDSDVLAWPGAVAGALRRLRHGAAAVYPFDGRFHDLRGADRAAMLAHPDPEAWPPDRVLLGGRLPLMHPASLGGAVIFDRQAFAAFGGYHERFVGWGYEDAEIFARMTTLGHRVERVEGHPLLHLSHPRGRGTGWYGGPRRNAALAARMARLDAEALRGLIAAGGLRDAGISIAPAHRVRVALRRLWQR